MTRHSSTGRAVRNVFSNWGGQAAALALSFFATPFIVRTLGDSVYGIWVLMASVAGYLGLLDIGVRGAVTRYVARLSAGGDDAAVSRTASSSLQIFAAAGAVAVLVSAGLALLAITRLGIPEEHHTTARIVLVLIGLNVAVALLSGTYSGIVAAMQRFDLLNLVDVLTAVARTGTIIVALLLGQGLVAMALIQLAVSVLRGAWLVVMSHRLYPSLRMDPFTFNGATTGMIFSFSIYSFVIHLSTQVIYYTDALVIASFLPIGLLTFYAIGGSLVEYARTLTRAVSYAASPMASALDGVGDHERVRRLLVTSAKFSMVILLPVAITLLVRGASFIGLWMGPAYTELSGHVVFALALPLLFHAGSHGLGGIMLSIGKHKGLVPAMIAEAAANVGLSVTLVGTMGIVGVAWGTAIPALVSGTCFWPWYVRRAVGISAREYFETIWIRPWLAAVPFLLASMAVERWWPATSLLMFFAQVFLCLLPAVAADWWICLNQRDHESLRAAIRKLTGRPAGSQLASST